MKHPTFYVANRAHHSDVGGASPGSMGLSREIYQEGVIIPPLKIMRSRGDESRFAYADPGQRANLARREGDLTAQIGACRIGAQRVEELVSKSGYARVARNTTDLLDYSERLMRAELKRLPAGTFR